MKQYRPEDHMSELQKVQDLQNIKLQSGEDPTEILDEITRVSNKYNKTISVDEKMGIALRCLCKE